MQLGSGDGDGVCVAVTLGFDVSVSECDGPSDSVLEVVISAVWRRVGVRVCAGDTLSTALEFDPVIIPDSVPTETDGVFVALRG